MEEDYIFDENDFFLVKRRDGKFIEFEAPCSTTFSENRGYVNKDEWESAKKTECITVLKCDDIEISTTCLKKDLETIENN